jgi:hypothetical protein
MRAMQSEDKGYTGWTQGKLWASVINWFERSSGVGNAILAERWERGSARGRPGGLVSGSDGLGTIEGR